MEKQSNTRSGVDPPPRRVKPFRTMSVHQAADVLGVHVNTVRAYIRRGELEPLPRATSGRGSAPIELAADAVRALKRRRSNPLRDYTALERAAYLRGYQARRRGHAVPPGAI